MMEFAASSVLKLLLLLPLFVIGKRFVSREFSLRYLWLLAGCACIIFALAGPFYRFQYPVRSFLILADVSRSMTVEDMRDDRGMPLSRLAFAKNELRKIVSLLPAGTAIGIGATVTSQWEFEENANIKIFWPVQPIGEEDMGDLYRAFGIVDWWNAWGDKSRWPGFLYSLLWMSEKDYLPRNLSIIVITDGGEKFDTSNEGKVVPVKAEFRKKNIRLTFIGVGGLQPRAVPEFDNEMKKTGKCFMNAQGQCFLSALDENNLKYVAEKFGARYLRIAKSGDLTPVFSDSKNPVFGQKDVRHDISWIFAASSLVFLILFFI
ncbi:MAG: hypothetical protein HY456_03250 [Parcubacteria group bacterium]|nr:hypothetical protein [Parcubacteria group bacterium]